PHVDPHSTAPPLTRRWAGAPAWCPAGPFSLGSVRSPARTRDYSSLSASAAALRLRDMYRAPPPAPRVATPAATSPASAPPVTGSEPEASPLSGLESSGAGLSSSPLPSSPSPLSPPSSPLPSSPSPLSPPSPSPLSSSSSSESSAQPATSTDCHGTYQSFSGPRQIRYDTSVSSSTSTTSVT